MAGSRINKFGSIFSRTEGLLRSGALSEKPIWFDVYRAFPPHIEPKLSRPIPDQQIADILYPEDYIRARFYNTFGNSVGLFDNMNQMTKNYKSVSQTFIDRYIEIARTDPNLDDDHLFERTTRALIKDGIRLKAPNRQDSTDRERVLDSKPKNTSISEIALSDN